MSKLKMTPVIGVKRIKASEPMTKKAYCDYRGWDVPKDEDPDDAVILVEYEPEEGKASNHPDHEGYISMSPVGVFEKAYKRMTKEFSVSSRILVDHEQRVIVEAQDLSKKLGKLNVFIGTEKFKDMLSVSDQQLMVQQRDAMVYYLMCLIDRINTFKPNVGEIDGCVAHEVGETDGDSIYMGFGGVIKASKEGHCLSRSIWRGTDKKFIFKQVPGEIKMNIVPKMQSLPLGAKSLFIDTFANGQIDAIYYANQLVIVGLSNTIDSYSPSAQDVFAEDWYIVD